MDRDMLKENRIHGDIMFPLRFYINRVSGSGTVLDCHWHEELELLMVMEGKAIFQVEASAYEVRAGEALFINSGEIHAGRPLAGSPCSFCAVVFGRDLLYSNTFDTVQSKYIEPLVQKRYSLSSHFKNAPSWEGEVLSQLSSIIEECAARPISYELSVKARLFLILSLIISHSRLKSPSDGASRTVYKIEALKRVIDHIRTNYHKKITLKELALLANMSEGHFCRFFKGMVHRTPVDYINSYRIARATALLEDRTKKILEVAMESGFENFSYFIGTFRHYMNCTPSEYRRRISKQGGAPDG